MSFLASPQQSGLGANASGSLGGYSGSDPIVGSNGGWNSGFGGAASSGDFNSPTASGSSSWHQYGGSDSGQGAWPTAHSDQPVTPAYSVFALS
jgi:hypothetical protein